MPSNATQDHRSWSDPRYFINTCIMPLSALVWASGTVFAAVMSVYIIERETNKSVFATLFHSGILLAAVLGGVYYTIGLAQVFFLELRERFIAHKVDYRDGEFLLQGYWFKRATFRASQVEKIEPFVLSERWLQKRTGSLLSRSTRFTIPHGKNVNLKITLADGRIFYFPGEMGQPGQWKDEDVKELRGFMEACVVSRAAPRFVPDR